MKKLLVMLLVLGFVSTVTATYNPGNYITVDAPSSALLNAIINVSVNAGTFDLDSFGGEPSPTMTITGGTISNLSINTGAGWGANPAPSISFVGGVITIAAVNGTSAIAANTTLFTFDILADTVGTLVIDATSGNWAGNPAVVGPLDGFNGTGDWPLWTAGYAEVLVEVPEPMTLALLGLGGLFLRRRRA